MSNNDGPVVNLCEPRDLPPSVQEAKRYSPLQKFLRSTKGVALFGWTAMTIGLIPIISLAPAILFFHWLGILKHMWVRRFCDHCTGNFLSLATFYFESALGIRVRTFGFNGVMKKRCVIIMNHVTHLDWMFLWSFVERQGDMSIWKAVTKNMLRQLPILGWFMQLSIFSFVVRKWEHDEPELCTKLYYLNGLNYPCQLLIFPEGGDFTYKTKKRSDKYANEKGYPRYQYCFHPRTTGFVYAMNALRSGGLDAVYDVTLAYPDTLAKTEVDFFHGVIPREIQFHIKSYDDKEIPEDDEELAQWCKDRWKEKEERLKNFYTHGKFQDGIKCHTNGAANGVANGAANGAANGVANGTHSVCNGRTTEPLEVFRPKNYWYLFYSIFIVISTHSLVFFFYWLNWKIFIVYFILCIVFLVYMSGFGGGLDYHLMSFKTKEIDAAFRKSKHWLG